MNYRRSQFAGILASCFLAFVGVAGSLVITPAYAQDDDEDEQPRRRAETLDPAVAKVLQEVFEQVTAEQYRPALASLNKLMSDRGDKMKAFDRATTLELRASVKVNLEDYRGALQDFQGALSAGALPPERNNQLRYYIAQLQFQLEDYQAAISGLQEWIRSAQALQVPVDANAYYLLAAAYTQITPPNFRSAMQPAEQSIAALKEPKKSNYDLLNLIYSELGEQGKRGALLEKMINLWPGERGYWTQLSGLYSQTGKDSDAFAVLEVAYRAGLLETEAEIQTLVQYYSFYENPYRGAKVLQREIEAGAVKRTVKTLTTLSQLWSQAREHKRAIPVLQEASRMSDTGELSYRLGQVLLADEQYAASEKALRAALNKGGMNQTQSGETWLLLGTAVFSQAGPEDRNIRQRAREAFVRATNYKNTSTQARQWVTYIDAIRKTELDQDRLEKQQAAEARKAEIERLKTAAQVCRLKGGTTECDQILEQIKKLESQTGGAAAEGETTNGGEAEEQPPAEEASTDEEETAAAEDEAEDAETPQ